VNSGALPPATWLGTLKRSFFDLSAAGGERDDDCEFGRRVFHHSFGHDMGVNLFSNHLF
jgi:hypothetical protein